MLYSRIDLRKSNYKPLHENWEFLKNPNIAQLNEIYYQYCRYKKFESVMPIFDSQYTDISNDVVGYYSNNSLVAFSIIKKHDKENVEAVQFAWTYHQPKLGLGIKSLKHECALYRQLGYKFLYLGGADEYKKSLQGFEILGPV